MNLRLKVILPLPYNGRGPGYTCGVLLNKMIAEGDDITIFLPSARIPLHPAIKVVESLPIKSRLLPFRLLGPYAIRRSEAMTVSAVRRSAGAPQCVYLWPNTSISAMRALKAADCIVIREMINCHRGMAKPILDDAYGKIGVRPNHTITDASIRQENEVLSLVDFAFCPNANVEASLLQNGSPASKILPTSYGWDPARILGEHRSLAPAEGPTFLFVGLICVRKGAHLLLQYWARSGIRGRLVLAGNMEPIIAQKYSDLLNRPDVTVLPHEKDIGALYRSADVFVFPSLEEGGPQVTYEACGSGLPAIVSPMGAGRIVKDGVAGYVVDPYDADAWIAALRALAGSTELRRSMGEAGRLAAKDFVWEEVATGRRRQMLQCLSSRNARDSDKVAPISAASR